MNPIDDYFYLGKIIKPNGYKGKVNAYFDTDSPELYADLQMVFIQINGMPVPYFIDSINLLNNKAVIAFKDVDNSEKAEALMQKELYLPLSELPPKSGNRFYYHEVTGFKVIDEIFGEVGPIKSVLEYPNQAVFQIMSKDKEVLIPINNDIINRVDRDKKEIHIIAPEGLIEIYLD